MSEVFNDIRQKVNDLTEIIGKKADEVITLQGLKSRRRSAKRVLNEQYVALGKIVYGKYTDKSVQVADEALPFCETIDKQLKVIEKLDEEMAAYTTSDAVNMEDIN